MEEAAKAVTDYGILVVIAAVFLVQYVLEGKNKYRREEDIKGRDLKYNESLGLLSKAIDNMASLIDLLRQSNENNNTLLRQHDERAIKMNENICEVKTIICNAKIVR